MAKKKNLDDNSGSKNISSLSQALYSITYPTVDEADIASAVFEHWIRTKTDVIWARDFAALARKEWPMGFYWYGWRPEVLLNEFFSGHIYTYTGSQIDGWAINVPAPELFEEETSE